jgi:lipid A 3-O-deacylase
VRPDGKPGAFCRIPCTLSLALLGVAGLFAQVLPAAATSESPPRGTLTLTIENDIFSGSDRHYTSGAAIVWVPSGGPPPGWLMRAARLVPWLADGETRHAYAVGQSLYTASNISDGEPPPGEPPYAGWLYGTVGLEVGDAARLDQLGVTLGVIGPAALGRQSQRAAHRAFGGRRAQGWSTQLRNEPGLVLAYRANWNHRVASGASGLRLDAAPYVGATLGNVSTHAAVGLTLRFGRTQPFEPAPRLAPGLISARHFARGSDLSWHLLAGIEGRAVARDIFLDGNTFRASRSVDKDRFVADALLGLALTWRDVRVAYTHVFRSREYRGDLDRDDFGALSVAVRF